MDLLTTKYTKAMISYEGIIRVETPPVPVEALREAVLNALIHKDYAKPNPIQISVYDHKIIIWNEGHLPEDWTVERLLGKHPSAPRNPLLANAFFRAGMIEAWGRGIEKIIAACSAAGLPTPIIKPDFGGMWVEFTFSKQGEVTGEVTGEVRRLLQVCHGEMTRQELKDALGLKGDDNFRQLYLVPALLSGFLEMTIPDKPNSRLQKYRRAKENA
jgi:ATP-dependent DNA helicase RecG